MAAENCILTKKHVWGWYFGEEEEDEEQDGWIEGSWDRGDPPYFIYFLENRRLQMGKDKYR